MTVNYGTQFNVRKDCAVDSALLHNQGLPHIKVWNAILYRFQGHGRKGIVF